MMEVSTLLLLMLSVGYVTALTWNTFTPCSQTCGGGHRYKVAKCSDNDINKCRKTYDECSTDECPSRGSCPTDYEFMYGRNDSCCANVTDTCGLPSVTINQENIYESKKAVAGQWPWAAVLVTRDTTTRHCSGCLIHKDWVLVGGFCVESYYKKEDYYVLLGSTSIVEPESSKQVMEIKKFILHENFTDLENDIGLVQLKKSAILNDYVKPICLPNGQTVKTDAICVAAGWGTEHSESFYHSHRYYGGDLRYVAQRKLPSDVCVNRLRDDFFSEWLTKRVDHYTEEQNLCFGHLSGLTCTADTGGPVMCQSCSSCGWYVAGLTLYGADWCGKPSPHVNVTYFEDWIKEKIGNGLPSRKTNSCKSL